MEGQTPKEHRTPRGADKRNTPTVTLSKIERDIRAYELTLQGCSVRGVCAELGIKSTQTAHNAIQRGKEIVIEKGIDVDERKIEIDKLFKETLGMLVGTARQQFLNGSIETIHTPDGTITKTRQGVDPRIAGELSRSLNRWAEFCGLLDRAPEVTNASTTLINLSAPGNGADFAGKWTGEAVETTAETVENDQDGHKNGHIKAINPAEPSEPLDAPTVYKAVEEEK